MRQDTGTVILFALVFLVCPALYFFLRALPFLVFYFLPLLLSAVVLGSLFGAFSQIEPVDYRRGLMLFPIAAFLLMVTIGLPTQVPPVPLTPKLEEPWLFNAFNDFSSQIEALINWSWASKFRFIVGELLPPERYSYTLYDLRDLSWSLWSGVLLGAPAVALFVGHKVEEQKIQRIRKAYEEKTQEAKQEVVAEVQRLKTELSNAKRDLHYVTLDRDTLKASAQVNLSSPTSELPASSEESAKVKPGPEPKSGVFGTDFI